MSPMPNAPDYPTPTFRRSDWLYPPAGSWASPPEKADLPNSSPSRAAPQSHLLETCQARLPETYQAESRACLLETCQAETLASLPETYQVETLASLPETCRENRLVDYPYHCPACSRSHHCLGVLENRCLAVLESQSLAVPENRSHADRPAPRSARMCPLRGWKRSKACPGSVGSEAEAEWELAAPARPEHVPVLAVEARVVLLVAPAPSSEWLLSGAWPRLSCRPRTYDGPSWAPPSP